MGAVPLVTLASKVACPLVLAWGVIHAGSAVGAELPNAATIYPFISTNQDLAAAIRFFGNNIGIGVNVDAAVTGKISEKSEGVLTRRDYLDQLAAKFRLVWFFDGTTLHVAPVSNVETEVFFLKQNDGAAILKILQRLDLYETRFLHRFDPRNRVLLISGPSVYVRIVKKAIEAAEKADRTETTVLRGTPGGTAAIVPSITPVKSAAPP
ncbi:type II secretory pathway component GspD/PulD (secretin) [Bradyrhizobium sp. USDA 4524]|uniref:hypothetical protein n=1 Tax=unclassified Bradyrhizobium TaxID=2631580 RepID=UPI0020A167E7|nr:MULTISPECIES: hypothetical protein [unclassified Bradyrhizobium]MCP1846117.1 type III secretion protein C [Bradyrhizobium sp. USDA 4538]MCP1907248.1 type III secretion protein C [Bradyrhizobium sp. USDA 4537]MCP1985724.1 type III secretion protein C [Bradyrhizobium sp. USDA 4539]